MDAQDGQDWESWRLVESDEWREGEKKMNHR